MNLQPIYITTTLPYVNGNAHVGHTVEFIRADILARYYRIRGHEVFFNTGIDEHGQKIAEKAEEAGMAPQEFVDNKALEWQEFCRRINMSYDWFSRTTDTHHQKAAQHLWELCKDNGYIYKQQYQTKYCVGCELEKTDSDLVGGRCPDHPNRELELIDEENYFFAFSKFAQALLELYKTPQRVIPEFRLHEIQAFTERGLHDFSISRLREKMSWGVVVPDDEEHVMYVWFDALTNYISCLGWGGDNQERFEHFWNKGRVIQLCGKDNLRQQTAIWQAMLQAGGLKNTDMVFCEGHITSGGEKMSKSLGNVVDPLAYIDYYGLDAVRYFVARAVHNTQDSDWTAERFHENYMSHLVNGLGNLVNRILNMADKYEVSLDSYGEVEPTTYLEDFDFNQEYEELWRRIGEADAYITEEAPFKKAREDLPAAQEDLRYLLSELWQINEQLAPLMPDTYEKIKAAIQLGKKPEEPLFPRLEFNPEL